MGEDTSRMVNVATGKVMDTVDCSAADIRQWSWVNYPSLKRRACTAGVTGGGAALASSLTPGSRGEAGAVDWAPHRHNSRARARMLREPFRSA